MSQSPAGARAAWPVLAVTIFLSAFLLFLVQPLIAKLLLPRFGGSAAVWTTCLVFFQVALLAGYAWADVLARRASGPTLTAVHLLLLLASLALLPIALADGAAATPPSLAVLLLLATSIGLPFVLLATTSPLLQSWTGALAGGRNPYRLFAVSNLASLAALAAYPWLIEPWLAVERQARVWSTAYAVYVVLACVLVGLRLARGWQAAPGSASEPVLSDRAESRGALAWTALAAVASFELVAITNHLTQNVPSFPMMWVLPLVIYLVTFVLCFDDDRWYRPRPYALATMVAVVAMAWLLLDKRFTFDLGMQAGVFLPSLFVVCMLCHGELARRRPPPSSLSRFYLSVAVGGAIGGALVGLGAPQLLPGPFEVEAALVLAAGTLAACLRGRGAAWMAGAAAVWIAALVAAGVRLQAAGDHVIETSRNFYGVLRVREYGSADKPTTHQRTLAHGGILHGQQLLAPEWRRQPTSYYTETSGVGRLLRSLDASRPAQVGLVGLGVGTLAAYGRAGDRYTFFEIDPAIVDAAQRHFSYLADSAAAIAVKIGDGRLLLQQEPDARFDAIVIDAFSGDAIPAHLLTREAVALYERKLRPDGVVALHISNRYLDLRPVVARIAAELGLHALYVADPQDDERPQMSSSDWILLARSADRLGVAPLDWKGSDLPDAGPEHLWTDGFSNIVRVLRTDRLFAF